MLTRGPAAWVRRSMCLTFLIALPIGLVAQDPGAATALVGGTVIDEFGTIETGKVADLLVLEADPIADISNIRKPGVLIRAGRVIDHRAWPTGPIMYRPLTAGTTSEGRQDK